VFEHEALNADDQISARRILKSRHEPGAIFFELLVGAVAEKLERGQNGGFLLDDAAQCQCAKCPVRLSRHGLPNFSKLDRGGRRQLLALNVV
jgi:hypothetical protein